MEGAYRGDYTELPLTPEEPQPKSDEDEPMQTEGLIVPPNDELPGWMARYAAWCLNRLRPQGKFLDLFQNAPAFNSFLMDTLSPAKDFPWLPNPPPTNPLIIHHPSAAAHQAANRRFSPVKSSVIFLIIQIQIEEKERDV